MKLTHKSILLAVCVMLISAVAAPGVIAAVAFDNETTNTGSTSDWQDGTNVTDIHNDSAVSTIEVQSDNASSGDDFAVYLSVNDTGSSQDGTTIHETSESWTATNSTAGHYELNVTHGEVFDNLEIGADEAVDVDVQVVVNETETSEESTTITVTAVNDDTDAVAIVTESEDGTDVADSTGAFSFNIFGDDEPGAATTSQDVQVHANNTTEVSIKADDSNVSDAWSESTVDASDGDFMTSYTVLVDGERVPAFYQSADSDADWLNTSSDVYATVDSNGDATVHNVNETVDTTGTVTFEATGNDKIGFLETRTMLSNYGADTLDAITTGVKALDTNGAAFDE